MAFADDSAVGVVLAGGRARRLGGQNKAFIELGGRPLVAHALLALTAGLSRVIVSANAEQSRFAALGHAVIPDDGEARDGPLAGILAALDWAAANAPDARAVISVATDTPFLPRDLVERLSEMAAQHPGVPVISAHEGRAHPVAALWPMEASEAMRSALERGDRGVHALAEHLGAVRAEFPARRIGGRAVDPFLNINTPEDLDLARAILAAEAA